MRIAEFIRTNIELIVDGWESFAKETVSGHELNMAELRDHAIGILHTIAADLEHPQSSYQQKEKSLGRAPRLLLTTEAEMHGTARLASGFSLVDAMAEFRALRASVLNLWSVNDSGAACGDDVNRFNEAIDQALTESLARLSASPDLNYIFSGNGDLIYANKAFADQYKLDRPGPNYGEERFLFVWRWRAGTTPACC
jgi:PAS domain-containing protein